LKKISQRLHNVTLQIESVNGDSVSARLWIDRQDNSDAKAINFDLRNLENNCKHITYDNSTTNKDHWPASIDSSLISIISCPCNLELRTDLYC